MKNHQRDEVIDICKGFTILWIIHIHTVFWSGSYYLPNYVRELSLFIDVPIFFFLSGYLLFEGPFKVVFKRCFSQFKRLYIAYVVFTLAIFFVSFSLRYLLGRSVPQLSSMLLDIFAVKVIFQELKGFSWNLWFLQTYLLLISVIPFFAFFNKNLKRNILLAGMFFIVFILLRNLNYSKLPFYVIFYGSIFLIGSIYRKIEKKITLKTFLMFFLLVLLGSIASFWMDNFTFVLQNNKFPPSPTYLCYSLIYLFLFIYVKSFNSQIVGKIHPIIKKLLLWSSCEVFNIYLMQSVVCSLPFLIIPSLKTIIPAFPLYCLTLLFNFSFSIFLVWLLKRWLTNFKSMSFTKNFNFT